MFLTDNEKLAVWIAIKILGYIGNAFIDADILSTFKERIKRNSRQLWCTKLLKFMTQTNPPHNEFTFLLQNSENVASRHEMF